MNTWVYIFILNMSYLRGLGEKIKEKRNKGGQRRGEGRGEEENKGKKNEKKEFFFYPLEFFEIKYDLVIDLFKTTLHCLKSKNVLG